MVSRNALGSNSRLLLEARRGREELTVLGDIRSVAVRRAIVVEPLDSRGEAINSSPHSSSHVLQRLLRWRASQHSGVVDVFPSKATVDETSERIVGNPDAIFLKLALMVGCPRPR
jgi:hypothetical protein